jgi:hypothetical protein
VAVSTQQSDVLDAVVVAVAIYVVKMHHDRLPLPLGDPAELAPILLETGGQQPGRKIQTPRRSPGRLFEP